MNTSVLQNIKAAIKQRNSVVLNVFIVVTIGKRFVLWKQSSTFEIFIREARSL
jgi:hypothetical protein